ncbi:MAG: HesA/MoeB/ThiF family protein [Pseudomonadota bacterium]
MTLTDKQRDRYIRHITLKEIGADGQQRLLNAKVLIVGVGGLGSPAALYLAATGVGTIGIMDGDKIDISNLHRQILYTTDDVGKQKVDAAKIRLESMNPDVKIIAIDERLSKSNAEQIVRDYDFVIDGCDNLPTKFLINDVCVKNKIAYSHAGITCLKGQTFTYTPGSTCLRCIFPDKTPPPPSCTRTGVLGALPGILGAIQAIEAIKFLTGMGELLTNKLLTCDSTTMEFRTIDLKRNSECPFCFQN